MRTEGKIIQWMILENYEMKDLIFELLAHSFLGSGSNSSPNYFTLKNSVQDKYNILTSDTTKMGNNYSR